MARSISVAMNAPPLVMNWLDTVVCSASNAVCPPFAIGIAGTVGTIYVWPSSAFSELPVTAQMTVRNYKESRFPAATVNFVSLEWDHQSSLVRFRSYESLTLNSSVEAGLAAMETWPHGVQAKTSDALSEVTKFLNVPYVVRMSAPYIFHSGFMDNSSINPADLHMKTMELAIPLKRIPVSFGWLGRLHQASRHVDHAYNVGKTLRSMVKHSFHSRIMNWVRGSDANTVVLQLSLDMRHNLVVAIDMQPVGEGMLLPL